MASFDIIGELKMCDQWRQVLPANSLTTGFVTYSYELELEVSNKKMKKKRGVKPNHPKHCCALSHTIISDINEVHIFQSGVNFLEEGVDKVMPIQ